MVGALLGTCALMILLVAGAVYSALFVAKKTDEIVLREDPSDEMPIPFMVRFPDSVFRK